MSSSRNRDAFSRHLLLIETLPHNLTVLFKAIHPDSPCDLFRLGRKVPDAPAISLSVSDDSVYLTRVGAPHSAPMVVPLLTFPEKGDNRRAYVTHLLDLYVRFAWPAEWYVALTGHDGTAQRVPETDPAMKLALSRSLTPE